MVYKIVSVVCDEINKGFITSYVELQYQNGKWEYDNFIKSVYEYPDEWKQKLTGLTTLSLPDYVSKHNEFGLYLGNAIKKILPINNLEFKVQLIALKGFNIIDNNELGNPAQIAATTGINVVSDLTAINTALGGNGKYLHSVAAGSFAGYEPAIQLALLAVLRWREENNFLAENTGAKRNSIGGAVWLGQEA